MNKLIFLLLMILTSFQVVSGQDASELPANVAPSQAKWYASYKVQKKQPNLPDPSKQLLNADEEPEHSGEGFVELFNGTDLSGWTPLGGKCTFEVKDGVIVGTCVKGASSTYLSTDKKDFGDFIFTCDIQWKVDGNTGVMFRAKSRPRKKSKVQSNENRVVYGPQVEMEGFGENKKGRFWSGGIYGQSCGGYYYPLWLKEHVKTQDACKREGWNRVTISAKGNVVKTWINGVPMAHWVDEKSEYLKGQFGLQVHAGRQGTISFRNLKVKELAE